MPALLTRPSTRPWVSRSHARERLPILGLRDIELAVRDAGADLRIVHPQVRRDHGRALARERLCLGGTLTSGGAGDDDDLARDATHAGRTLCRTARECRTGREPPPYGSQTTPEPCEIARCPNGWPGLTVES